MTTPAAPSPAPSGPASPTAAEVIAVLGLEPHPEGGHYRRTFTHPEAHDGRPLASAIAYLLAAGDRSHWHRVDAVELWCWQGGDPLELSISVDGVGERTHVVGPDPVAGHELTVAVPAGAWQSAQPVDPPAGVDGTAGYALVTCVVAPAFVFEGFELAPPCWTPGQPF